MICKHYDMYSYSNGDGNCIVFPMCDMYSYPNGDGNYIVFPMFKEDKLRCILVKW